MSALVRDFSDEADFNIVYQFIANYNILLGKCFLAYLFYDLFIIIYNLLLWICIILTQNKSDCEQQHKVPPEFFSQHWLTSTF